MYLVIDVGTSGCRAMVVSGRGEIQSQSHFPVKIDQPRPFFAEIDTDRLWLLVQKAVRSEIDKHHGITFDAIGVSAMLGYVFLDKAGLPLMPAIIYADNRATAETEKIEQLFPEEKFFEITGRKPSPFLLAPKIKWLASHRPDTVKKLGHIIGLKDDIVRRLGGSVLTDFAHLDYSGMFNVFEGKLESDILEALDLEPNLFPVPAPATAIAGTVTAEAAGQLGLIRGTPVIVGSSDGTTAMYAAGVLDNGTAAMVSGTTDVLMMYCPSPPRNISRALSVNSGMVPGSYLVGGPQGLSGGTLQYFEQLLQTSAVSLEKKINDLPPGSDGLLMLPGLAGERSPFWKEYLTGTITGLTPEHKSEHFLRAVMEGCALRTMKLLEILSRNGLQPRAVNVAGGGANIDAWNQVRSDAFGMEVRKLATTEATSLGTAIFCKAGLDKTRSLKEIAGEWLKVDKRFRPDEKHTRTYRELARLFEAQIQSNREIYKGLNRLRCESQF